MEQENINPVSNGPFVIESIIKGLAITAPNVGRITIGHVEQSGDGKKRPVRDDFFHITSTAKLRDGGWAPHPLEATIMETHGIQRHNSEEKILRSIPIRVVSDKHHLNVSTKYTAFDKDNGRVLCTGDGECAKRRVNGQIANVPCPGAENCDYGAPLRCKPITRLNVRIEGQKDPLAVFTLRTAGWNTAKALHYKMAMYSALTEGKTAGLPLNLVIRSKASRMSMWTNFYYVDLVPAEQTGQDDIESLETALASQKRFSRQEALDRAAEAMLRNGAFETTEEDFSEFEELLTEVPEGEDVDQKTRDAVAGMIKTASNGGKQKGQGKGGGRSPENSGLDSLRRSIAAPAALEVFDGDTNSDPMAGVTAPQVNALRFD